MLPLHDISIFFSSVATSIGTLPAAMDGFGREKNQVKALANYRPGQYTCILIYELIDLFDN